MIYQSSSKTTGFPAYSERSGQVVTMVRKLTESEVDSEVGRMFKIRFADGIEAHVFEDELVLRTA